jgi:hypothetical protein
MVVISLLKTCLYHKQILQLLLLRKRKTIKYIQDKRDYNLSIYTIIFIIP